MSFGALPADPELNFADWPNQTGALAGINRFMSQTTAYFWRRQYSQTGDSLWANASINSAKIFGKN
jgi:hypothetical protein